MLQKCCSRNTVICAMSAVSSFLPPLFIYPKKRMVDLLVNGASPQSVGLANLSGWTDSSFFVDWLEHLVKSQTHRQQIATAIIRYLLSSVEYAKKNHGIKMVTRPPHCTHKMQPLHRTFFRSPKTAHSVASDSWTVSNPGNRISF